MRSPIEDTRNDLSLHANYYTDEGQLGLGGGLNENDYTAMSFGFDGSAASTEEHALRRLRAVDRRADPDRRRHLRPGRR
jgi:hypothetical protein